MELGLGGMLSKTQHRVLWPKQSVIACADPCATSGFKKGGWRHKKQRLMEDSLFSEEKSNRDVIK
jgi:hypothetical protein